jgi:exonuclease VII large subunit
MLDARVAGGERNLAVLRARLDGKDPDAILQMGYARVEHEGRMVRDPAEVPAGGRIAAHLARGTLYARVEPVTSDGNQ